MRKGHVTLLLTALALSGALTHARDFLRPAETVNARQDDSRNRQDLPSGQERRTRALSPAQAAALYGSDQQSGLAACADQFPGSRVLPLTVVGADMAPLGLCSNHFAVIYSPRSRTPLLVVERLDRDRLQAAGNQQRSDNFYPDPRLRPEQRAELADYRGSGWSRGHMSPAADQPDAIAMQQSFALSNMVPQDPVNNGKPWNKIEQDVRRYARRAAGDVFVFTGPLFDDQPETIGRNRVWVPARLFKLIYDADSGRAWGHVLDNTAEARIQAPLDYADFVRNTGLDLLAGHKVKGGIAR